MKVMTGMDVSVPAVKGPDINGLTGSVRSAEKSAIIRIGKGYVLKSTESGGTGLQCEHMTDCKRISNRVKTEGD